jgi:hypothetical protein
MLSTLAGAIGNSHVVEIKKGWIEGAVLYIAVVGDPGSKKTPALKVAIAPAKERQVALQRAFREAMNEYHAEVRQWQLDKKRAGENDEPAPPPPEQPVLQRTIVSDTTVEALAELLQENLRGLNCIRDELAGWWRSMDQYKGGKGSDRQVWLEIWSTGFFLVDRKGRKEPVFVPRAFVCVTGSTQPDKLPELKNMSEDGLPDRFLYAFPDRVSSRDNDNEISDDAIAGYQEVYDRLVGLEMMVDENGEPYPQRVKFTEKARKRWGTEADALREEMEHPEFPRDLEGPWSKFEAYLARLSLILALDECCQVHAHSSLMRP